jgi:hypothetical protein
MLAGGDLFAFGRMDQGETFILSSLLDKFCGFLVGYRAQEFSRSSNHPGSLRNILGHHRPCANNAPCTDPYAVQDDRPNANKTPSLNVSAMNDRSMAHRNEIFQHRWQARICMKNRSVLDVRALADHDLFQVAPNDRTVPDAGALPHLNLADYGGVWGNKCRLRKIGGKLERSCRKR